MGILRSSFFTLIVTLLLAMGYGLDQFGDCCKDRAPSAAQQLAVGSASDQAPAQDDGCQCICHQTLIVDAGLHVAVSMVNLVPMTLKAFADEIPPDAVPLGIDYPPQLA